MSNYIESSSMTNGLGSSAHRYALASHDPDGFVRWSVGGEWSASLLDHSPTLMTGPEVDAFKVRHPNARIVDVIVYREACEVYSAGCNSVLDHSERSTPQTRQAAREAGIKALIRAGFPEDALNIVGPEHTEQAPAAMKMMKTFEVTGCGFDGATDETDDRVFWVKALSHNEVRAALAGTKAGFHEIIGSETDIDFHLPVQADLLKGKLLEFEQQGRKMQGNVSNYTGLTQDLLNALATKHRMTPGAISVSSDGTKSVVLERDDVDDLYCQAILTVHSSGAVACHTGLYRERAIINNGWHTEPSVEVAIANASAVFDDLIVRHAEVRKEENYQSPGM